MNFSLIYLVYGLAFFGMGILIWSKIRSLMDSKLARAFGWLVAFGMIYGVSEWIEMFKVMGHIGHETLFILTFLVALSFAALLQFGIEIIGIKKKLARMIHFAPVILFFLWFLFYLKALSYENGAKLAGIWSRYTLGFSGAFLTAYALTFKRKEITGNRRVARNLFLAGIFFGFFGVFTVTGLHADFFPGLILNQRWFIGLIGLPVQIFRILSAIAITYFVVKSLDVFDVLEKRMLTDRVEETTGTLERAEVKYSTLFELAGDALLTVTSPLGEVLDANEAAVQMLGYSKEELRKLGGRDIIAPEVVEEMDREWQTQVKDKGRFLLETIWVPKEGPHIPVEVGGKPLEVRGERLFQLIGRDISERKRVEEEIRHNYQIQSVLNALLRVALLDIPFEKQLELIIGHIVTIPWLTFESKGGIFLVEDDPEVLVMKAHRGFAMLSKTICARVPFGRCLCGRAALTAEIQFADCIDNRHENLYEGISPHGHYCVPILSGDKTIGVLVLYLREGHRRKKRDEEFLHAVVDVLAGIIHYKRTEQELNQRQEALQSIYESVITQHSSFNDFCDRLVANLSKVLNVSHVTVEHLKGNRIKAVSMSADGRVIRDREMSLSGSPCERVYEEKAVWQYSGSLKKLYRQDVFFQEHDLHAYLGIPIKDSVGDVIGILNVMDRQERTFGENEIHLLEILARYISNEIERNTTEVQLRQSQKLEAVGQLAGGVAHDFNNMMTVVTGYCEYLLSSLNKSDSVYKSIKEIMKAGQRAASLAHQLLAFSRKQILQPEVLDINTTITNIEKLLRRLIGEDIDLVVVTDPALGRVKADPDQIDQIIMNLAVNARDAMPKGGKLTIETANAELDEAYTKKHVAVRLGPYVMLAVSDTGCGMDSETQSRIFEPFFTTKEEGKGTGLGLSTVYGIVRQSGGNIWVYSEPGHGTSFKIYLPLVEETAGPVKKKEAPPEALQGKETILLVEDEEMVRSLARLALVEHGYTVLEASNGVEALKIFEHHNGLIHLVLTDVVMPRMSGHDLIEHISLLGREVKVLYMSGYTDNAIQHHGILSSGTDFLQKPFTPTTLLRKIREALERI